ncbi:MAG: nitrous oxide-stimulated promoter family protein [Deltaproteobacteria bacterium]|nr:nitrous oxide-stimulated promoter family protein [Candidatus Anaeroferrophillus wilburensis]MBN2887794.1 nitrous oxide-stimulated promoter family protein [Deltaproteobacteria bacterium]
MANDNLASLRIQQERETIARMIALYCRKQHKCRPLCPDCRELLEYAWSRIDHCPLQEKKTTCGRCPIHCYKPAMRERIRAVMRYAGPKMLWHHPLAAIRHMLRAWFRKT